MITSLIHLWYKSCTSRKHLFFIFGTICEQDLEVFKVPKLDDTGVYRKKNGCWEYRFGVVVGGKTVYKKKSTDEHGNKLLTKSAAIAARDAAMVAVRQERTEKPKLARRMVKEVFEEFCAEGRKDRAYGTIRKQDSIWENHLRDRFGNRYVDEISSADVVDYLAELYYVDGLAFKYVESFLKMFYRSSQGITFVFFFILFPFSLGFCKCFPSLDGLIIMSVGSLSVV